MPQEKLARKHKALHQHLDKKLQFRLRVYVLIALALFLVDCYEMLTGSVGILFFLVSVIVGIPVGFLTARMYHLSWNHDAKQIVARFDRVGIAILIFYAIFTIFREWVASHFFHGSLVIGVSLAVATGVMIGRVIGTRGKILKILKEEKIF